MQTIRSGKPTPTKVLGRLIPDPIIGVTLDDVSNLSAQVTQLQRFVKTPTVRIVFDEGVDPAYYTPSVNILNPKNPPTGSSPLAYVMSKILG